MIKSIISLAFAIIVFAGCDSALKNQIKANADLLRLNNAHDSAVMHKDIEGLKRLYAEEFTCTNPEGKFLNRQDQLSSVSSSEIKWESGKSNEILIKLYGKTAVMTGLFTAKGDFRGNPLSVNERFLHVWIKTDTSWQLIAEQSNVVR